MLILIILLVGLIGFLLIGSIIAPYIAFFIILLALAIKIENLHGDIKELKKHLELNNKKSEDL